MYTLILNEIYRPKLNSSTVFFSGECWLGIALTIQKSTFPCTAFWFYDNIRPTEGALVNLSVIKCCFSCLSETLASFPHYTNSKSFIYSDHIFKYTRSELRAHSDFIWGDLWVEVYHEPPHRTCAIHEFNILISFFEHIVHFLVHELQLAYYCTHLLKFGKRFLDSIPK